MTSSSENLCLNLLSADSEADVIGILRDAGYWDDPPAGVISVMNRRIIPPSATSRVGRSKP